MRFIYVILFIGVALVFYLSWIPNPNLDKLWFIPDWLGRWTDTEANENIRTGVPFLFLGLFAGLLLTRKPFPLIRWIILWVCLSGIVVLAEVGQLFLPHRAFSWADIGWGATGGGVGLLIAAGLVSLRRR